MRTRTKLYLLALPALPYLFGVALQVSGVTNIKLSVAIFEIAALLGAGVVWALWSDWRTAAAFVPNDGKRLTGIRRWDGVNLRRLGCIRTEFIAATIVFLACNALIYGFVGLAEKATTPVVAKSGARLFPKVGAFSKEKKTLEVTVPNTGDVIARMASKVGSATFLFDHILSEREENNIYKLALGKVPPIGSGIEIPPNTSRTLYVESGLSDAEIDSIMEGTRYFYVVNVIAFNDEITPKGQENLASVCGYFTKRTDFSFVCSTHNESRLPRSE